MKKNLKTMTALFLALCLFAAALSGCGNSGETTGNSTEKVTETETKASDGKSENSEEKNEKKASSEDGTTASEKKYDNSTEAAENTENKTDTADSAKQSESSVKTTEESGKSVKNLEALTFEVSEEGEDCWKVSFNVFPEAASQFEGVDITNEYIAAAAIMLAFVLYETDPDEAIAALTVLSGPNGVSDQDKSFIKNQFAQYPYVARSYFEGASPANDYLLSECAIEIRENLYSRSTDGYVKLLMQSAGADSARELQLRQKGSTGEWFMNSFMGILSGIREPESTDEWDGLAGSDLRTFQDSVTSKTGSGDEAVISVSAIPTQAEFEQIDLTDEYKTAAAVIFALSLYETDKEACFEALEYLNGPSDLSDQDKNLIKSQFEQYPYVARSYFEGASPSNDYKAASYAVTVSENANSFSADNFVTVYVKSSGADSPRAMSLRLQRSTGMWFVTSFGGALMGVRTPASNDPWN